MEDDLISQCPDDILISIIKRIPTKETVRTSILSKKWRNIYKFVPAINVSCSGNCRRSTCDSKSISKGAMQTCDAFTGLHRVSQLHSGFVHSLEYRCCLNESSENIFEECIKSLGNCIEELLLQFSPRGYLLGAPPKAFIEFSFSLRLLSYMPSLKCFKLGHCTLQPNFHSHCNSLKSLRLSKIRAVSGSLECILSNCLSLGSLLIRNSTLPSKICFRGSNLQLKCIRICDSRGIEEIELHASNLITFEFISPEMVDIIFDHVPQLQSIYISEAGDPMSYCLTLGKDSPRLRSLLLTIGEQYIYENGSIGVEISMFRKLQQLDLCFTYSGQINLFSLTPVLHNCPLLQEFHLATWKTKCDGPQSDKNVTVHPQLKKVDISGFNGAKNQYDFVAYLLKSCVGLQHMFISLKSNLYYGFDEWMDMVNYPFYGKTCQAYERIEQLKHQADSKAQVIFQENPRLKSKQVIELVDCFDASTE